MKKLIIIPAYNEANNIPKVINDIKLNAPNFDYIIINDCSTDNTKELCKKMNYNVLNLPVNLGIGGGVQAGYKYAQRYDYDIIVQFDGDGQHNAEYIEKLFINMQNKGLDMIIGSRFIENNGFQSSMGRRIGIKILSRLIEIFSKNKITDPTSGFRMINKNILDSFCTYYPKDYPEPESVVDIIRQGFKVGEMPVVMNERISGESSINLMKSIYYMVKVSLAIVINILKPTYKEEAL